MQTSTVKDKVRIFISSKIDNKYQIMRKALARMLEETGLVSVYTFEDYGPSSCSLEEAYLTKVAECHLCIFIIDNEDGVPDGVYKEYKRAIELERKSIYFFCNERQKTPTQIQQEIQIGKNCKYKEVPLFDELVENVYKWTIQDILDIYQSYCSNRFKEYNSDNRAVSTSMLMNEQTVLEIIDVDAKDKQKSSSKLNTIDKSIINNYDQTKNILQQIIFVMPNELTHTSSQDSVCAKILAVIIGEKMQIRFLLMSIKIAFAITK